MINKKNNKFNCDNYNSIFISFFLFAKQKISRKRKKIQKKLMKFKGHIIMVNMELTYKEIQ
jgi:hypothetical protein